MKIRWSVVIAVISVTLTAAAAIAQEPGPGSGSNPFLGHWVGVDGVDGSINTLTVGGGNHHVVHEETGFTACFNAFGEFAPGSIDAFATIDGDTLTFVGTLYCDLESGSTAHPYFSDFTWVASYDAATGSVQLVLDPTTRLRRPPG